MSILDGLTPTEWLILEVLAARHRLGMRCWTFPTRVRPTVVALARLGLVKWKAAPTEGAVLVSLTDKGIREWHLDEPDPTASGGDSNARLLGHTLDLIALAGKHSDLWSGDDYARYRTIAQEVLNL